MKCPECQSELFLGGRHCPVCGMAIDPPPAEGKAMSKSEFFRLALPQKFQSFLHTGIFLCYLSVLVGLIASFWYPVSGALQSLFCLIIGIGLQITKSVIWAYSGTVLAAGTLVISVLADGNFVCLITLIACIFACVGGHALSVLYAAYLASGKTPEIGDEEGRTIVRKYTKHHNFRIVTTAVTCLLIGAAATCSIVFYFLGQAADRDYTPGELTEDGRYVNEFAGIDLTLPEEWIVYSRKDLDTRNIELLGAGGDDSVIFLALSPDRNAIVRLDIVRQSSSIYTEENLLKSYVDSGMLLAESEGVAFRAEEFQTVPLGGADYLSLTTVTSGNGINAPSGEVRRTYLCRQIGSYSVIFFLYDQSDALFPDFSHWFSGN